MAKLEDEIKNISYLGDKQDYFNRVRSLLLSAGYRIVEEHVDKPWGGMFRIDSSETERFITEFFPGLTLKEASHGVDGTELSPKILLVEPGQRLSWQYHHRRSELWRYLTAGAYRRSDNDEEGNRIGVNAGEMVQFEQGERHRLEGLTSGAVIVAEIWQHTDPHQLSDEEDIVRLSDDYSR